MTLTKNQSVSVINRDGTIAYHGTVAYTYSDGATVAVLPNGRRFSNVLPAHIVIPREAAECPICGESPRGEGCYFICPNSPRYYTAEQEREDEANWSSADYLRETYGDPDLDR